MAHPYVQVNGPHWTDILKYLKEALVAIALHDGIDQIDVTQLTADYVAVIEGCKADIFVATAVDLVSYVNFYQVAPRQGVHDEFKSIYFTGMAVSRRLLSLGLVDLNKLHLRAVLRLMDFRLHVPLDLTRKPLTERILKVIDNNALDSHFGKYGWYLVYKCLYNAENEKSKAV